MKKHFALSILTTILIWSSVSAQNDNKILMSIGNDNISQSEFVRAYTKNNALSSASEQDLRNYLDLYVNFRLKVKEAKAQQLDTSKQFVSELGAYRTQSSQPYLIDKDINDRLIDEAFDRYKYHVRASHILISCPQESTPKDTLTAYNRAIEIRNKILNGMDFATAAITYSDDPSTRDSENSQTHQTRLGNHGDLGYFTTLDLIYAFENSVYSLNVGEISMPVKTQYGYHLIYLTDKQPSIQKIYVSQIFIADTLAKSGQMTPETKSKIDAIMSKKNEITFEELAKQYSDDKASLENDARVEPFGPSYRPGNYVYACLQCKPGEVSKPVSSSMGWHIMRLNEIKYKNVGEESRYLLKNKIAHDDRSSVSVESLIEKLKKEYNYQEKGKKKVFSFIAKHVNAENYDSVNHILADLPGAEKLPPICTYADQEITLKDFVPFLSRHSQLTFEKGVNSFLNERFPIFCKAAMLEYEDNHLEAKYPEFNYLMQEFHDGMLLYEINSKNVWVKAIEDTTGLNNFYESIKNQYPTDPKNGNMDPKPMSEIRSAVITEYQNYLDRQWIQELKRKYPVVINEEVFKEILSSNK